jgi:hypothetical protein
MTVRRTVGENLVSDSAKAWVENALNRRADRLKEAGSKKGLPPALFSGELRIRAERLVTALELVPKRSGLWTPRGQLLQVAFYNARASSRLALEERRNAYRERAFSELSGLITQARDAEHFRLLEEIGDPSSDGPLESVRAQLAEKLSELHEERLGDQERTASDAVYYFLCSIGHQWAIESERSPDLDADLEKLRAIGLAADLGISEAVPEVFLSMLLIIEEAIGPWIDSYSDSDWTELIYERIEATFFDDRELLGLLEGTLVLEDSRLVTTPLARSEGDCLRLLLAERWAGRRAGGVFPWGERAVCPIPDPLRPGSVKELPPLDR